MIIPSHSARIFHRLRTWNPLRLLFRQPRLHDRLRYMAVLRSGIETGCSHARLRTGFLVEDFFLCCGGNDILCQECKQVWVATEMSEQYEFSSYASARTEGEPEGIS